MGHQEVDRGHQEVDRGHQEVDRGHQEVDRGHQDVDRGHQDVDRGHQAANQNVNNIIIAYLNVHSFVNKYNSLKTLISGNVDIMVVGETKLDESYTTFQSNIAGYSEPCRLDRDKHG